MNGGMELDEGMMRHFLLNSIRANRVRFKDQFGELVIACDSKKYWRREVFPYYKASRSKGREASSLDWPMIFKTIEKLKLELLETFPYKVIEVEGAEADDVIAVLAKKNSSQGVVILSRDHDFRQLHQYSGIKQWDPIGKKKGWVACSDPKGYLAEHIIKGDPSDGVPNILSADDTFVTSKRQGTLTKQRMAKFLRGEFTIEEKRNWHRNKQLVDFSEFPQEIQTAILNKYEDTIPASRKGLLSYMIKHRLKKLTEAIQEF